MGHAEAPAWWAEVQHLRDVYERSDEARRRADQADLAEHRASLDRRPARVVERRPAELVERRSAELVERRSAELVERRSAELVERRSAELVERRSYDAGRPAPVARRGPHPKGTAIPARRTVEIRGRTVPAPAVPRVELDRRRPPRRAIERVGPRPDRLALWALLMGLMLILVAVGTADASVLAR